MKRTLYLKFVLAYLLFAFFGFIVVATFTSSMTLEHMKRERADLLYKEALLIADSYAADLYNNEITLESVWRQIEAIGTFVNASIWIVNPSGLIVLDSSSPLDIENSITIPNFSPAVTGSSFYTVGNFFGMFDSEMISAFAPITSHYKVKGYVIIHASVDELNRSCESLLNISYITLVILFLLSLIILLFFTEMVYLPLRRITHATEQYAIGNFRYEIQVDSEDEIGYLAASLAYMAGEVAKSEDNQKQLVANISHDFRSPLTSMRGYLEAMLDGTIPPELHEKYIRVVLNETDRLAKLTNSLLTLNNLNTKGMILDRSCFDINQVIKNTAASFEGTCRQKLITIELVLTGEEMTVNADMVKIQQVLYNLVDNAIKFSHKNSSIKIETVEKSNKLLVSVKDNGIGIPKDSIRLIWDRFYKTDLSRGKDRKGTGLGLSITKEIIQSHNENINVVSTEGVGTEFIFTLEKVDDDQP